MSAEAGQLLPEGLLDKVNGRRRKVLMAGNPDARHSNLLEREIERRIFNRLPGRSAGDTAARLAWRTPSGFGYRPA